MKKENQKRILLLLHILFWPAGMIYYFIKRKQIKEIKEKNWFLNHPFITWIGVYFAFGIIISFCEETTEQTYKIKETQQIQTPQKDFISESLFELHSVWFRGRMTDLQKEELWKDQYQGKYVNWTGSVKSIDKRMLGRYTLLVVIKTNSYTIFADASIKIKKSEADKLMKYSVWDKIDFQAQLDGYGDILEYFYLKEGIIIEE